MSTTLTSVFGSIFYFNLFFVPFEIWGLHALDEGSIYCKFKENWLSRPPRSLLPEILGDLFAIGFISSLLEFPRSLILAPNFDFDCPFGSEYVDPPPPYIPFGVWKLNSCLCFSWAMIWFTVMPSLFSMSWRQLKFYKNCTALLNFLRLAIWSDVSWYLLRWSLLAPH